MATKNTTKTAGNKAAKPGDGQNPDQEPENKNNQANADAGKTGDANPDAKASGNEGITLEDLQSLMTDTVESALKKQFSQEADKVSKQDIADAVKEAFEQRAKEDNRTDVPNMAEFKAIAEAVVDGQFNNIRQEKKPVHNTQDAQEKQGMNIERPLSMAKGNLPTWAKQLCNILLRKHQDEGIDPTQIKRDNDFGQKILEKGQKIGVKALTSTGSGTGDELVPTDLGTELFRRMYLESQLAQAMMAREIEMPTNPFTPPVSTTRPSFFVESTENTAATASTPGTAAHTLTAVPLKGEVDYSYEVDEDSIIAILPMLTMLFAEAAAFALEDAIINGDADGTHQDSDYQAVTKHNAKAFNGLRRAALATSGLNVDLSTGGISRANLSSMRKALGKYAYPKNDLFLICGPKGENDVLNLDEVVTIDKAGRFATFFNRDVPTVFGSPVITSEAMRETLNASGVYDGVTTTKGSIMWVNLRHWSLGNRRSFTVETDKNIQSSTNIVVGTFRKAFSPVEAVSTTVTPVSLGYNYDA